MNERYEITERLQTLVAQLVATQPAGAGLCLIGGFRYRMLDRGPRRSVDIDFHWTESLTAKRTELIALFQRRLLPEAKRRFQVEGSVTAGDVREESDAVAVIDLAFWRLGSALGRIEIPVAITRIDTADAAIAKTFAGTVFRTVTDADMLESKVIAILCRSFLEHRDLLDLYLFASHATEPTPARIAAKLQQRGVHQSAALRRIEQIAQSEAHHAKSLDAVIQEQVDASPASLLAEVGGGQAVFNETLRLLRSLLGHHEEAEA